jgi:hypothetical protein
LGHLGAIMGHPKPPCGHLEVMQQPLRALSIILLMLYKVKHKRFARLTELQFSPLADDLRHYAQHSLRISYHAARHKPNRPSWGNVGAILRYLETILGSCWSMVGPWWGHLGASWGNIEAILGPSLISKPSNTLSTRRKQSHLHVQALYGKIRNHSSR